MGFAARFDFARLGTVLITVTLGGAGSLNVHTLQVDAARTFTLNGGSLALNTLNLMSGATPASLLINGNVNLSPFNNAAAVIANGVWGGQQRIC